MIRPGLVRMVVLCGLLGGVAAACAAQAYTPPPPPLTTLPPCPADKDAKKRAKRKDCDPTIYPSETVESKGKKGGDTAPPVTPPVGGTAADKFPFPGEQPAPSVPAAKKFPYPGESAAEVPHEAAGEAKTTDTPAGRKYSYPGEDTRNVPHDPAAEKKAAESSAGKAFPYPGESKPDSTKEATGASPRTDDSASSSSSSSSSSSDDDVPGATGNSSKSSAAKNPDDDDEDQPKLQDKGSEGKRSKKVIKPQTDAERVDEDLSVAKFYGQSGNYMGAYLRAKDAVRTQPEFPEGHFVLGEAAKRLKKNDEAVTEFQAYLKLAPDGQQAKAAEKALDELK